MPDSPQPDEPITVRLTIDVRQEVAARLQQFVFDVAAARKLPRVNRMDVMATLLEAALDDEQLRQKVIEAAPAPAPRRRGGADD